MSRQRQSMRACALGEDPKEGAQAVEDDSR